MPRCRVGQTRRACPVSAPCRHKAAQRWHRDFPRARQAASARAKASWRAACIAAVRCCLLRGPRTAGANSLLSSGPGFARPSPFTSRFRTHRPRLAATAILIHPNSQDNPAAPGVRQREAPTCPRPWAGPLAGRLCDAEKRRTRGRARSALRDQTRRACLNGANAVRAVSCATGRESEHRRAPHPKGGESHSKPCQWPVRGLTPTLERGVGRTAATRRERLPEVGAPRRPTQHEPLVPAGAARSVVSYQPSATKQSR